MRSTWLFRFCILSLGMLAACQKPDTAVDSDKNTRLVWLTPNMPCEAGEPNFGKPNCYMQRKRDAVAVLRVPKRLGADRGDQSELVNGFTHDTLIVESHQVLLKEAPDKFHEWQEKLKKLSDSEAVPEHVPSESEMFRISSPAWRVTFNADQFGHIDAYDSMRSFERVHANKPEHGDMRFVRVSSPLPGFTAYAQKDCIGHMVEMKTNRGQLSKPNYCDFLTRYYLAENDKNTYVKCQAPWLLDGKILDATYCNMHSVFPIEVPGFKPGYIAFTTSTNMKYLKSGFWKHMNKRFEEWLKSLVVSQQELLKIQK